MHSCPCCGVIICIDLDFYNLGELFSCPHCNEIMIPSYEYALNDSGGEIGWFYLEKKYEVSGL